jgi:hypothetical protein
MNDFLSQNLCNKQKKKKKNNYKNNKKTKKEKKWYSLWVIHQSLQIGCKLKWENFKNHANSSQFFKILIIIFFIFYVVETCSKFGFWFQIRNCSNV